MNNDTQILPLRQSETIVDPLTELAREGARRMLTEALKAEADAFVASFADEQLDGRHNMTPGQGISRHPTPTVLGA
jgi:putative transposase